MADTDFFDVQVNGYGGVDFNQDDLTDASLHHACELLVRDGVRSILATVITEDASIMCKRIRRIARFIASDSLAQQVIAGIHIEGPFISDVDGYRGAHPVDAIRPADTETVRLFVDAGEGLVKLFTLAPERDAGLAATRFLTRSGIRVSIGHSNATLDQLHAAVDAGLSVATHVGNGCPMTMPRHDNIVQRLLSFADQITLCFIADGVHVPFFALKNYLNAAGLDRCIVTTDAMAAAGMGPGRYRISRWDLEVGEDLAVWAPDRSHLVGSAGTMQRSKQNLREHLGFTHAQCDQLLKINPAHLFDATREEVV